MAAQTNGEEANMQSNGASNGVKKAGNASRSKPPPPVAKPTRETVDSTFDQFSNLLHASNRPLPNRFGDGKDHRPPPEKKTGVLLDIATLRAGGFFWESVGTLRDFLKGKLAGGPTDDRTMIVSLFGFFQESCSRVY
jgi:hypothetical protein